MPIINLQEEIALTAGGGTVNLDVLSTSALYVITGTATLTSNWTIQPSGTPLIGTTFIFSYEANIDLDGNSITIFSKTLPPLLSDKTHKIEATWDGSNWEVNFIPDISVTGTIPPTALSNYNVSDKEEIITVPISFETGELGKQLIFFPYESGFDIHGVFMAVTKTIEASDPAYITFYEDNGITVMTTTLGSSVEIDAGSVSSSPIEVPSVDFTSNVSHNSGTYIQVGTTKTTPGGKMLLYFIIIKH